MAPALASAGAATIGSSPAVQLTAGLGGAPAALLLGAGPASRIALPLLGGTLLVSPSISVPTALDAAGAASFPFTLPNTESIIGSNVNLQGLVLDAGAVRGVSMTNGLEMWIG